MSEQKNKTHWENLSRMKYLRESRKNLWNLDYFEFLVKHVWKMDKPIRILDMGCGMGYLGSVLLPLLPEGSTYTGIDIGEKLLDEAQAIFSNYSNVDFILQDLNEYEPTEKYDLVICQCVLIHIPSPQSILDKMIKSVIPGGRVICIEPNWVFTNLGVYRHKMEVYSHMDWGVIQKWFDGALQHSGRDSYIGIKIPAMMHDLGLKNIDIRINDKANFNFQAPDGAKLGKDRIEGQRKFYENPEFYDKNGRNSTGMTMDEQLKYFEGVLLTEKFENDRDIPLPVVEAAAWLISYGEKPV